jgi:hypothetical protein
MRVHDRVDNAPTEPQRVRGGVQRRLINARIVVAAEEDGLRAPIDLSARVVECSDRTLRSSLTGLSRSSGISHV